MLNQNLTTSASARLGDLRDVQFGRNRGESGRDADGPVASEWTSGDFGERLTSSIARRYRRPLCFWGPRTKG